MWTLRPESRRNFQLLWCLVYALEAAKYTDANGMPRAPKSIAELMARKSHRKDWADAVNKEISGLVIRTLRY